MKILIVDDEPNIRRTLRAALEAAGHAVGEAETVEDALRTVDRETFDVALVDLRIGRDSGLDLLDRIVEQAPRTAVVIITAHAGIDNAVNAMRRGAFDDLPKPFTPRRSAPSWKRWNACAVCAIASPIWKIASASKSPRPTFETPIRE